MPPLPSPLRVVLCGRMAAVGKPVAAGLLPDYEVIHFIQSVDAAIAELPHLLAGRDPQAASPNDVGTHDYSQPARAVIFGRGYQRSEVEEIRRRCAGSASQPIAWVIGDPANAPTGLPPPGYAQKTGQTIKDTLDRWRADGGVREEIYVY
ncbi:hypothetical protein BDV59DRAFT_85221 [Aspergillus ambiguus]|uniref:uncharacterized protein n=1 Tax=Aspergillus ambiguus TaxID=176160 RepID=UPI003CCE1085